MNYLFPLDITIGAGYQAERVYLWSPLMVRFSQSPYLVNKLSLMKGFRKYIPGIRRNL